MTSVSTKRIQNVTAVILAGGPSSRMKSNKALLPYRGGRFIDAIYRLLRSIFTDVIVVTNNPEQYDFLPCNKVPDIYKGMGVLAGIHSGLYHSSNPAIFAVACDMPYLKEGLIRYMASRADACGVLIPESPGGLEPLHAFYGKECLAAMEAALLNGQKRIVSFFDSAAVSTVHAEQIAYFDPAFASFININTPDDYYGMRNREQHSRTNTAIEEFSIKAAL
ncbi:MAG: molybdenum cofactor guanylyltransferase [Desulfuromonadaceae bacterium]